MTYRRWWFSFKNDLIDQIKSPIKGECIGHVQKTVGARLRKFKKEQGGEPLNEKWINKLKIIMDLQSDKSLMFCPKWGKQLVLWFIIVVKQGPLRRVIDFAKKILSGVKCA